MAITGRFLKNTTSLSPPPPVTTSTATTHSTFIALSHHSHLFPTIIPLLLFYFRVDWTGKVSRINYNEPLRESFLNVTVDDITDVYHAYNYLTKMFYDPRFVVTTKMIPGDMLTIDNDRLLHGRTAYDVRDDDVRWLHQAYVDWDVLRSKLCTLQEKLCQNISTNE